MSGATRPQSIALLPVEATVKRARVVETEGLVDESVVYGEMFNSSPKHSSRTKGYQVQVVDAERINSDPHAPGVRRRREARATTR